MSFTPRSVGLIAAAAVAAGWLGASLTNETPAAQVRVPAAPPRAQAAVVMPRAERLREHAPSAPQPKGSRNPFVYGQRVARPAVPTFSRAEVPAPVEMPTPLPPPAPMLRLSGIASNTENGAAVWTAILSDNGSLVFAKIGEKLSNGYSVAGIDERSVTLADATGATLILRLP